MMSNRATPWILFKEDGQLVCKRCGKSCYLVGATYDEIRIEGERFQLAHKPCKPPKPETVLVKR